MFITYIVHESGKHYIQCTCRCILYTQQINLDHNIILYLFVIVENNLLIKTPQKDMHLDFFFEKYNVSLHFNTEKTFSEKGFKLILKT